MIFKVLGYTTNNKYNELYIEIYYKLIEQTKEKKNRIKVIF